MDAASNKIEVVCPEISLFLCINFRKFFFPVEEHTDESNSFLSLSLPLYIAKILCGSMVLFAIA